MSARAVTLRALVVEDIARAADKANRPAAAMLLRLRPDDTAVAQTVAADLRNASTPAARVAGAAASYLSDAAIRVAAGFLAEFCGLSVEEWTAETCTEQGVEVVS